MGKFIKNAILFAFLILVVWLSTPFTVLVVGSDAYGNNPTKGSRSDGLILIKVTPLLAKIKMISIPRDTYVEIPCEDYKTDKITHSHAYGGMECTIDTVENLLETKVNYSVLFRFSDIINITDLIDGVEVEANHTFSQDYFEQEVFHFKKGKTYNLKGKQALSYIRHRKSDSAFKRDERQRQVIQGIVKKLLSSEGRNYIPEVYSYTKEKMDISFNPIRVISALPAIIINKSKIEQFELKGDGENINDIYYYILDEVSLDEIKREFRVLF